MAKPTDIKPEDLEALAGEYVVGVLDGDARREFETLASSVSDAAEARTRWENRMSGLNSDYSPLAPPASVKSRLDERLFASTALSGNAAPAVKGGLMNALGFWRGLGMVGSAAAIALGVYTTRLNESLDDTNAQLSAALEEKAASDETLKAFEAELAARNEKLSGLETELARSGERVSGLETELASAREKIAEADNALQLARAELEEALNAEPPVLVVSLESGETDYRFLAVHEEGSDKVRMTLVSGEIESEKDFELWLVEPDKQVVSLGVVASGKSAVELTPEYVDILEKGGLLAVSIEQKGGSPTGVAQGPVVAVGAPREL